MNTEPRESNRGGERASWLRVLTFGALWATVSAGALLAPGCYGRNCEGGVETFGVNADQGLMIDENTWASSPMTGTWLWFPRQRVYSFEVPALGGRTPEVPEAFISVSPEPKSSGDFVPGAGNLTKFSSPRPNGINVYNDSCSDYYLRLVLKLGPLPPVVNTQDAGGADAGESDAGADLDAAVTDAGDGGDGG